jgi:adenylate kinase
MSMRVSLSSLPAQDDLTSRARPGNDTLTGMNVLLIGPPGSGKGTQGNRLAERLGLDHIAAGDLLRAEVAAGTELGRQVADLVKRGELVPDQLIIDMLKPRMIEAQSRRGYLLDGFPRSVVQAKEARKFAEEEGMLADAVIYLDAPRPELITRVLARAKTLGRLDDTPETIETRLHVFDEATRPLIDYYRDRGLLHIVNANRSADEVTDEILSILDEVVGRAEQDDAHRASL